MVLGATERGRKRGSTMGRRGGRGRGGRRVDGGGRDRHPKESVVIDVERDEVGLYVCNQYGIQIDPGDLVARFRNGEVIVELAENKHGLQIVWLREQDGRVIQSGQACGLREGRYRVDAERASPLGYYTVTVDELLIALRLRRDLRRPMGEVGNAFAQATQSVILSVRDDEALDRQQLVAMLGQVREAEKVFVTDGSSNGDSITNASYVVALGRHLPVSNSSASGRELLAVYCAEQTNVDALTEILIVSRCGPDSPVGFAMALRDHDEATQMLGSRSVKKPGYGRALLDIDGSVYDFTRCLTDKKFTPTEFRRTPVVWLEALFLRHGLLPFQSYFEEEDWAFFEALYAQAAAVDFLTTHYRCQRVRMGDEIAVRFGRIEKGDVAEWTSPRSPSFSSLFGDHWLTYIWNAHARFRDSENPLGSLIADQCLEEVCIVPWRDGINQLRREGDDWTGRIGFREGPEWAFRWPMAETVKIPARVDYIGSGIEGIGGAIKVLTPDLDIRQYWRCHIKFVLSGSSEAYHAREPGGLGEEYILAKLRSGETVNLLLLCQSDGNNFVGGVTVSRTDAGVTFSPYDDGREFVCEGPGRWDVRVV